MSIHPSPLKIAEEIVRREGGYVNDPDDPGGATKYGVTIHTMRRLGLDLDGDGRITAQDVQRLSMAEAVEIFLRHYFKGPKIDRLPERLRPSVFDMYVNAGSNAIKILQRLLNETGLEGADLVVDGVIGPQTLKAAHLADKEMGVYLRDAYGIARRDYYYRIADNRPASRKYARRRNGGKGGWITRAEEFMAASFHLTDREHTARTAHWG
ncbi:MAG: holin-associated N-acetylmuramidase [Pseudomonadota bacterium]